MEPACPNSPGTGTTVCTVMVVHELGEFIYAGLISLFGFNIFIDKLLL